MPELKCEGSCSQHQGLVRRVRVWDKTYDWGYFSYCDVAIAEDRKRGLTINENEEAE